MSGEKFWTDKTMALYGTHRCVWVGTGGERRGEGRPSAL